MIIDQAALAEIRQDWVAVRKLSSIVLFSRVTPSGWIQENRQDEAFNLPLLLAYSVLERVLSELRGKAKFQSPTDKLGPMMKASKQNLPWVDFSLIDQGRLARNALAHEAKLVSKHDCLRFIEAIEIELKAWASL